MIICGDNLTVLPTLSDESVDLIVTDPPYGWAFMGKDWDKAVPSVAVWKECLRVLKPGAFAFVMSGPRMDCLSEMGKRLAEAGFEIAFSPILWAFASGFPKAANMGKLVDKRKGVKRKITGKKHSHYPDTNHGGDNREPDKRDGWVGYGGESVDGDTGRLNLTAPATPEAQALDGSYAGFQPKPAVEVIIVAMKPKAHGTYIDQALDNGKGISWLDDCRIPYEGQDDFEVGHHNKQLLTDKESAVFGNARSGHGLLNASPNTGRFPANLLIQDDVLNDGREYHTHMGKSVGSHAGATSIYGHQLEKQYDNLPGDSGGFSRYFSLDSWWQAKLSELPESVQRTFPFLIVPKAGKKEKEMGLDDVKPAVRKTMNDYAKPSEGRNVPKASGGPSRNRHPTVKPLKLMCYLVTLGSRPGDLVLDPFAGTCTTGMAAKMLGRDWLMVEISEEWCRIGRRRLDAIQESML